MALKTTSRAAIPPFMVMEVMSAAKAKERAGETVIHLEAGQPSTPAPACVRDAVARALPTHAVGYTEAFGMLPLRERIAQHCAGWYGVDIDPARIAVTVGSSAAFTLSFLAAFEAGDRVAMATPATPRTATSSAPSGSSPWPLPTTLAHRFQPTIELLEQLDTPPDGLIVASPANPTGTMLAPEELSALCAYCRERGIRLISDELYHGITFAGPAASALQFTEEAVVINSFSKYFCMTGWRLGWMVLPEDMIRPIECLAQNFFISPPTLSQLGAISAFDAHDELTDHVRRYAANREILLGGLTRAGITRVAPADGAFYIYADVSHLTDNSLAFCDRVLKETGVALTPGVDFDSQDGQHWVRLSFAGATHDMNAAVERLVPWLQAGG